MTAVRMSPLRALLTEAGVALEVVQGVEVAGRDTAPRALADLSTCDRLGLKGRGAPAWLQSRGIALPPQPNRWVACASGLLVGRYGETEFALTDLGGAVSGTLEALRLALQAEAPAHVYAVPRADSQAAFGLAGPTILRALEAVCPADLRPQAFGPGMVLQTRCCGVSAQLWNLSAQAAGPGAAVASSAVGTALADRVLVLGDASMARHLWQGLRAAVTSAGGEVGSQGAWFRVP